jgi:gamma-glutamylcyclotransferase (GGCT)/AIG2-like uncharacterized protein YtfP
MQQKNRNKQFNVFCYGTLEFDIVMKKVAGATFPPEAATLIDYARYMVKNAPYPAVIEEPGAVTEGTLFRGLGDHHMRMIDEYEGSLYDRITSEVLTAKGELIKAYIYIVPATRKHFVGRVPWSKEEFTRYYLSSFCKTI